MADAVVPPEFAPIAVVPAARQVACPAAFGPLAMVATLATEELQCEFRVRSCVLPSLNVPIAENGWLLPALAVASAGLIASDTSVPLPTVRVVVPFTPEADAVMVTDPAFFP